MISMYLAGSNIQYGEMMVSISQINHFQFEIAAPNLENYALPPDGSCG